MRTLPWLPKPRATPTASYSPRIPSNIVDGNPSSLRAPEDPKIDLVDLTASSDVEEEQKPSRESPKVIIDLTQPAIMNNTAGDRDGEQDFDFEQDIDWAIAESQCSVHAATTFPQWRYLSTEIKEMIVFYSDNFERANLHEWASLIFAFSNRDFRPTARDIARIFYRTASRALTYKMYAVLERTWCDNGDGPERWLNYRKVGLHHVPMPYRWLDYLNRQQRSINALALFFKTRLPQFYQHYVELPLPYDSATVESDLHLLLPYLCVEGGIDDLKSRRLCRAQCLARQSSVDLRRLDTFVDGLCEAIRRLGLVYFSATQHNNDLEELCPFLRLFSWMSFAPEH